MEVFHFLRFRPWRLLWGGRVLWVVPYGLLCGWQHTVPTGLRSAQPHFPMPGSDCTPFLGLAQRVLMNPAPSVRQSVRLSVTKVLILPVISFF